jgi:hypothetical protein
MEIRRLSQASKVSPVARCFWFEEVKLRKKFGLSLSQLWDAISVGEELFDARAPEYVPHPLIHTG